LGHRLCPTAVLRRRAQLARRAAAVAVENEDHFRGAGRAAGDVSNPAGTLAKSGAVTNARLPSDPSRAESKTHRETACGPAFARPGCRTEIERERAERKSARAVNPASCE